MNSLKHIRGGYLIAFEGIDGAGKTTQAKRAVEELARLGYDAIYLREPTNGPHGTRLRELMIDGREHISPHEEFELFRKDREEDVRLNICPALDRGAIVCIDRYYISSMAYQGALGLDPEFIRIENEKIAPQPHLILYFWLPVEESLRRITTSRSEGQNLFERREYQEKVLSLLESFQFPQMVKLDAREPVDKLLQTTLSTILAAVEAQEAYGHRR